MLELSFHSAIIKINQRGDKTMESDFIGAALAFIVGAVICFGNFKLSEYFLKNKQDKFSYISVIRQAVQVVYILILFFTAKYTPWDRTFVLVGGALGVTLPMFIFTYRLLKTNNSLKTKNEVIAEEKEGENNG